MKISLKELVKEHNDLPRRFAEAGDNMQKQKEVRDRHNTRHKTPNFITTAAKREIEIGRFDRAENIMNVVDIDVEEAA